MKKYEDELNEIIKRNWTPYRNRYVEVHELMIKFLSDNNLSIREKNTLVDLFNDCILLRIK